MFPEFPLTILGDRISAPTRCELLFSEKKFGSPIAKEREMCYTKYEYSVTAECGYTAGKRHINRENIFKGEDH